jgi:hypothetical protein
VIEKSAARLACLPSLPTMPIPTLAACIIDTSFPPSPEKKQKKISVKKKILTKKWKETEIACDVKIPIAADLFPVCLSMSLTTAAFCSGEHLKQDDMIILEAWS